MKYASGHLEVLIVMFGHLNQDLIETCEENENQYSYSDYCKGIDDDGSVSDDCDCNYFQSGAAGCIRNGQSQ